MLPNKNRESIETMAAYLRQSTVGLLTANESHFTLAVVHASTEDIKHHLDNQDQQFNQEVQQALRLSFEAWTSMMTMTEDDYQDTELLRKCLIIAKVLPARLGMAGNGAPSPTSMAAGGISSAVLCDATKWDGHLKKKRFSPEPSKFAARVCRLLTAWSKSDKWSISDLADSDFEDNDLPKKEEAHSSTE